MRDPQTEAMRRELQDLLTEVARKAIRAAARQVLADMQRRREPFWVPRWRGRP